MHDGADVDPVAIDSSDGRAIVRHSTAHVMAQAVQALFPDAKLGIGPPIENGFYYDFDVAEPFTPDDLARIDKRMQQIIKEAGLRPPGGHRGRGSGRARRRALQARADRPQGTGAADAAEGAAAEVGGGELTIYDNLARDGSFTWKDLCRGPHVPTTRRIPAYKLMRVAAAYWRGSEKNPQLQRIYGTAWESRDALKDYQHRLAEAEKRDHRKLGAELDLYSFPDEIGSGLAVFHPKGGVIRRVMEDYVRRRHEEEGFAFVASPHISKQGLFETSGHLPYYADTMFPPMEMEGEQLLPQGHELPDAQPDLPVARAVLP